LVVLLQERQARTLPDQGALRVGGAASTDRSVIAGAGAERPPVSCRT
jgi:hypothetical protein